MKTKKKLILGVVILVLLCLSFFIGDGYNKEKEASTIGPAVEKVVEGEAALESTEKAAAPSTAGESLTQEAFKSEASAKLSLTVLESGLRQGVEVQQVENSEEEAQAESKTADEQTVKETEKLQTAAQNQAASNEEVQGKEAAANTAVDPEKTECSIAISCSTILSHMEDLTEGKAELIPADGVILKQETVSFEEGDSVFDVLQKTVKAHKIHMEFVNTPIYESAYIEGINNLYEFDCGPLSGWMYKVNGSFPSVGCNLYLLKPGDQIEWVYTCDLGRDVGGYIEGVEK